MRKITTSINLYTEYRLLPKKPNVFEVWFPLILGPCRIVALARSVVLNIRKEFPVEVRYGDVGVFPSHENRRIHEIVLRYYGLHYVPDEKDKFEFDECEAEAVEDLFCLAMLFYSDFEIVTAANNRVFITHDEAIEFRGDETFIQTMTSLMS